MEIQISDRNGQTLRNELLMVPAIGGPKHLQHFGWLHARYVCFEKLYRIVSDDRTSDPLTQHRRQRVIGTHDVSEVGHLAAAPVVLKRSLHGGPYGYQTK